MGEVYLNFLGKGGPVADFENSQTAVFRYVSAYDVMRGTAPKAVFKGKIVLIGSSSEVLRDVYSTPINNAMPGAELLATQIVNIRDGEVLRRSGVNLLAMLVAGGLLAALLFSFLGPVVSLLLTVLLCGGGVYASIALWDEKLEIIGMVQPLLIFIGLFLWNSISGFVVEWRSSRNLKSTFGQYVPPELAKRMGERHTMSLEGESREISVLFSDVRNFTSISETFAPQELTKMMNRMLTVLSEEIHNQNGTVDKFIGDAVMAFWNAPLDDPDHAAKSVASAMAMQVSMQKLSDELVKEGHPPMRLGVGICSGEANVGNMGSKLRMAYTAMGDTVNVASRVEGLTKYYRVGVLVTESTYALCTASGIKFRLADEVRVKGRDKVLKIYEPLGNENLLTPEKRAALEVYDQMRLCYVRGDFADAMEKIKQYRTAVPNDGLAEVYEERISEFLQHPPAEWDGVTNFETK
ncbi:MAG: adenylate/guanylate cyclase domain-containing protein [Betaproteobacteria bacterium]|nr:adenylate/guanylate cyclase domain-containing protein [Betaproteobacteria bacterium]